MAYLIPLRKKSEEVDIPDTVIEFSSDTLALEVNGYDRGLEAGYLAIEPYRPNFRRRFNAETSYQIRYTDTAMSSAWVRGRLKDVPDPNRGKVLHRAHAEKLGRFSATSKVAVLVNDEWETFLVDPHTNPELEKRQEAKLEKKEKNERRRHERRPSLLERVLAGFLPED
jgi:hypothetical protein